MKPDPTYFKIALRCGLTARRAYLVAKLLTAHYAASQGVGVCRIIAAWVAGWSEAKVAERLSTL